ncbi:MAG: hypothetical protein EPN39_12120 [Chitinophagaceae bacterium]|nr:MAG: hypothetical protein EPN39_12120 [Chitinophagaceae bacterium]
MSNLSDKTSYIALKVMAQMVHQFEKLKDMDMTKEDDWDTTSARNLLEGIIQSNGYRIDYSRGSKRLLKKVAK